MLSPLVRRQLVDSFKTAKRKYHRKSLPVKVTIEKPEPGDPLCCDCHIRAVAIYNKILKPHERRCESCFADSCFRWYGMSMNIRIKW